MTQPRPTASILLLVPLMILGTAFHAQAFHHGGVGPCQACHTMHNSQDGQIEVPGAADRAVLLKASTPSDLCLSCHASAYGAVLGDDLLNPPPEMGAGNFVFLRAINLNDGPDGATNPIGGDAAGHNLDAPDHGLAPDATITTSPGGNYPAVHLGCTSCHDPHGNGEFRLLRLAGDSDSWGNVFTYPPPEAVGLDVETGGSESSTNHTAYHEGVSNWCANCHAGYLDRHNRMQSAFRHHTDRMFGSRSAAYYNAYNGTDDPAGGDAATAYLAEVPFEDPATTTGSTAGPTAASRFNCLSCHRAHGSSGPRSGRWDFNVSLLVDDGVISGSYPIPDPYQSPNQEPLCDKCHNRSHH